MLLVGIISIVLSVLLGKSAKKYEQFGSIMTVYCKVFSVVLLIVGACLMVFSVFII